MENKSPKFKEYSWANHFDFASRAGRYSKHESIIVWTALISHAFLDGYELLDDRRFLDVAESACRWMLDLPRERTDSGTCISYLATGQSSIHNSNMLGAAVLARAWRHTKKSEYLEAASEAMKYSCSRQRADGAWWYAEDPKFHWIDNFHTGYNLDSLKCYIENTGDRTYRDGMREGAGVLQKALLRRGRMPPVLPQSHLPRRQPVHRPGDRDPCEFLRVRRRVPGYWPSRLPSGRSVTCRTRRGIFITGNTLFSK